MHSKLYIPARSATLPFTVDVTPESAGWTESSLQVSNSTTARRIELHTGDTEVMILPLAGGGTVECDGETFELAPRASVFDGPSDMVYLGIDQTYVIAGEGRFAICGARAKNSFPNRRVAAADVSVELRGAGNCSRQVHNFGTAGVFEADSLIACEVITPGGNWSSYPAHKHDENTADRDPNSRRSTTSRSPPARTVPAASATTGCTAPRTARSRCSKRSAPATSCWCRTAITARRSPRPATTCTTST